MKRLPGWTKIYIFTALALLLGCARKNKGASAGTPTVRVVTAKAENRIINETLDLYGLVRPLPGRTRG